MFLCSLVGMILVEEVMDRVSERDTGLGMEGLISGASRENRGQGW